MTCHYFSGNGVQGFVCTTPVYKYKGITFEFHPYCGPVKLNKDGEPSKQQGIKFLKTIQEWVELPEDEQEKYNIG